MTRKRTDGDAPTTVPPRTARASVQDAIGKLLGDDAACDAGKAGTPAATGQTVAVPRKSPRP